MLFGLVLEKGPNTPSEARFLGPIEALEAAEACASCHPAQYTQWKASAHAHSSLDNPWYLVSFEETRERVGAQGSQHCGGCHDPVLLATGALGGVVRPETPRADEGVTCLVCHGIAETGTAGNGDYTVDLRKLPDPTDSVRRHRKRMRSDALEDGTVCRGCHRGFLTPAIGNRSVLPGFDDWGEWEASGWAGSTTRRLEPARDPKTCVDCHFAEGHAAPGGRTDLATQTGNLFAVVDMLEKAVEVDIPVVRVDGERIAVQPQITPEAGSEVELQVVVRNVGAGHSFPGGLSDTQDIWLRVTIQGAGTRLVAGQTSETGVHFRATPLDTQGRPERQHRTHRIAVKGFDHTIPPGEASVVRVQFEAPGGPIEAQAEVVHRSHRAELHEAACVSTGESTLDACRPQVARVIAKGRMVAPDARALFAHALGMSRGVQEEVGEGLASLEGLDDPRSQVLRARILGRQGRADAALDVLDALPAEVSDHGAVWRARGDALAQVWRWDEAAVAYRQMARVSERDPASFRDLARARGSAGDAKGALDASEAGLALLPRDPDLLRSRALALQDLKRPEADEALEAWLSHRRPDDAGALRTACDRLDDECGERLPIPTMRAVLVEAGD